MNEEKKPKRCEYCKHFNRHYTIAENKLSLIRSDIGTCKLYRETNLRYLEARNHACSCFEPIAPIDNFDDMIYELKRTAKNLDYALWAIKEELKTRKENK